MLVDFRVRNYRSIAEEVHLSMVAGRGSELANHMFPAPQVGEKLLRSAVLFGANGSGKSTVVAALQLLQMLVAHSATRLEADDPIPVRPFLLDAALADAPTRFEVLFVAPLTEDPRDAERKSLFRYTLAATAHEVVEESLEAWPKGRLQTWFVRKKGQGEIQFGDQLTGDKRQIERMTRRNVPFLAAAAQHGHRQLTAVHAWFRKSLRFVSPLPEGAEGLLGRRNDVLGLTSAPFTTLKAHADSNFRQQVEKMLRFADTGVESLAVKQSNIEDRAPADLVGQLAKLGITDGKLLDVRTAHRRRDEGPAVEWALEQESQGTRDFYEIAGPWLDVIGNDYTVVIDETFNTLHPALTRRLLEQLHSTEESRAQVVFTSHDVTLLDPTLLRRDQIWFTEKTAGATSLYSLMDFQESKPRKGEMLLGKYLLGKYGAVPLSRAFPHASQRPGAELPGAAVAGDAGGPTASREV